MRVSHVSVPGATLLALLAAGVLIYPALAQLKGPEIFNRPPEQPARSVEPAIRVDVELALANVTVTDPYNRSVTGLEKENFRVFEDGVEQEVSHFSSEDVPISVGVIFDVSGSMSNKIAKARQAAVNFFRAANLRDEFFLVSFNERAVLNTAFTSRVEEIQNSMLYLAPKGTTALFDGIYLGLSQMRRAQYAKRALLVISDGADNHSRYSERDIREFLKEADCQIYSVGIFDDIWRSQAELYGPMLLAELAEMSGGRGFTVSRINDLPNIVERIGMQLRNQYLVGYRPSNTQHDGSWRKIKVRLNVPKGLPPLNVYAKTGYYAPR